MDYKNLGLKGKWDFTPKGFSFGNALNWMPMLERRMGMRQNYGVPMGGGRLPPDRTAQTGNERNFMARLEEESPYFAKMRENYNNFMANPWEWMRNNPRFQTYYEQYQADLAKSKKNYNPYELYQSGM